MIYTLHRTEQGVVISYFQLGGGTARREGSSGGPLAHHAVEEQGKLGKEEGWMPLYRSYAWITYIHTWDPKAQSLRHYRERLKSFSVLLRMKPGSARLKYMQPWKRNLANLCKLNSLTNCTCKFSHIFRLLCWPNNQGSRLIRGAQSTGHAA